MFPFDDVIMERMLRIKFMGTFEISLMSMPENLSDDKFVWVRDMGRCRQTLSHLITWTNVA